MRRSRLKILPSRCVATLGFILLLLACPTIAEESVRPADLNERETSASHAHARIKNAPPDGLEVCQVEDKSLDPTTSPVVRTTLPIQDTAPDETRRLHQDIRNVESRAQQIKERILTRSMERKAFRTTPLPSHSERRTELRSSSMRSERALSDKNRMISNSRRDPINDRLNTESIRQVRYREERTTERRSEFRDSSRRIERVERRMDSATMERINNFPSREARRREVRSLSRRLTTNVPDYERLNSFTPVARKMSGASRKVRLYERQIHQLNREDTTRVTESLPNRRSEIRSTGSFRTELTTIERRRMMRSTPKDNILRQINNIQREGRVREPTANPEIRFDNQESPSKARESAQMQNRIVTHSNIIVKSRQLQRIAPESRRMDQSSRREEALERRIRDVSRDTREMSARHQAREDRSFSSAGHTDTRDFRERTKRSAESARRMVSASRRDQPTVRRENKMSRTNRNIDPRFILERRSVDRDTQERREFEVTPERQEAVSSRREASNAQKTITKNRESKMRLSRSLPERISLARDNARRSEQTPIQRRSVDMTVHLEESLARRIRDVSRNTPERLARLQTRELRSLSSVRRADTRDSRERTSLSVENIRRMVSSSSRDRSNERRLNDLSRNNRETEITSLSERRGVDRNSQERRERTVVSVRHETGSSRRETSNRQRTITNNRESKVRLSRSLPEGISLVRDSARRSEPTTVQRRHLDQSVRREDSLERRIRDVSRDTPERSERLQAREIRSLSSVRRADTRDSRERKQLSLENIRRMVSASSRDRSNERRLNELSRNNRETEIRSLNERRSVDRDSQERRERTLASVRREAGSSRREVPNVQRTITNNRESRMRLSRSLTEGIPLVRDNARRSEQTVIYRRRIDQTVRQEDTLERRMRDVSRDTPERSARLQNMQIRTLSSVRPADTRDSREQTQRSVENMRRVASASRRYQSNERQFGMRLSRSIPEGISLARDNGRRSEETQVQRRRMDQAVRREDALERHIRDVSRDNPERSTKPQTREMRSHNSVRRVNAHESKERIERSLDNSRRILSALRREQSNERRVADLSRNFRLTERESLSLTRTGVRDSLELREQRLASVRREAGSSRREPSHSQRTLTNNRESRMRRSISLPEGISLVRDNARRYEQTAIQRRGMDQSVRREESLERRIRDVSRYTPERSARFYTRETRNLNSVRRADTRDSREQFERSVEDSRRLLSVSRRDQTNERRYNELSRQTESASPSARRSIDRDSQERRKRNVATARREPGSLRRDVSNMQRTIINDRESRMRLSRSLPEGMSLAREHTRRNEQTPSQRRMMAQSTRRDDSVERRTRDTHERSASLKTSDTRSLNSVRRADTRDSRERTPLSVENIRRMVSASSRDRSNERRLNELSRNNRETEIRSLSERRSVDRDSQEQRERTVVSVRREAGSSRRETSNRERTITDNRESRVRLSRSLADGISLARDNARQSEQTAIQRRSLDPTVRREESLERRVRDFSRVTPERSARRQMRETRSINYVRSAVTRDSRERTQLSVENNRRMVIPSSRDRSNERRLNELSRNNGETEIKSLSERRSVDRDSQERSERTFASVRRETGSSRREISIRQRTIADNREIGVRLSRSLADGISLARDNACQSEQAQIQRRILDQAVRREESLERRLRDLSRVTPERSAMRQTRETRSINSLRSAVTRDSRERTPLYVENLRRTGSASRRDWSNERELNELSRNYMLSDITSTFERRNVDRDSQERRERTLASVRPEARTVRREASNGLRSITNNRESRMRLSRSLPEGISLVRDNARRSEQTVIYRRTIDQTVRREEALERRIRDVSRDTLDRQARFRTREIRSLSLVRRAEIRDSSERTARSVEDSRIFLSASRQDRSNERRLNELSRNYRLTKITSLSERRSVDLDSQERRERTITSVRREAGSSRREVSIMQRTITNSREFRMRLSRSIPEGISLARVSSSRSEQPPIQRRSEAQYAHQEESFVRRTRDVSRDTPDRSVRLHTREIRSLNSVRRVDTRNVRELTQLSVENMRRMVSTSPKDQSNARRLNELSRNNRLTEVRSPFERRSVDRDSQERMERSAGLVRREVGSSRREISNFDRIIANNLESRMRLSRSLPEGISLARDNGRRSERTAIYRRRMDQTVRREQSLERRIRDVSRGTPERSARLQTMEIRTLSSVRRDGIHDLRERIQRTVDNTRRMAGTSRRDQSNEREFGMRLSRSLPEGISLARNNARRSEQTQVQRRRMDQTVRREESLERRIRDVSRGTPERSARLQTRDIRTLSSAGRTDTRFSKERAERAERTVEVTRRIVSASRRDLESERRTVERSRKIRSMEPTSASRRLSLHLRESSERFNLIDLVSMKMDFASRRDSVKAFDFNAKSKSNAIKSSKDVTMPVEEDSAVPFHRIVIETTFKIYAAIISLLLPSETLGSPFFDSEKLNLFSNDGHHLNSIESPGKLGDTENVINFLGSNGDIPQQLMPLKMTTRQRMLSATIGGCIAALSMSSSMK